MVTEPITIPKSTALNNKKRSSEFKMSQAYWDLPSLDDNSVQDAISPFVPESYTEDSEFIYIIPKEYQKLKDSQSVDKATKSFWQRLTSKFRST